MEQAGSHTHASGDGEAAGVAGVGASQIAVLVGFSVIGPLPQPRDQALGNAFDCTLRGGCRCVNGLDVLRTPQQEASLQKSQGLLGQGQPFLDRLESERQPFNALQLAEPQMTLLT